MAPLLPDDDDVDAIPAFGCAGIPVMSSTVPWACVTRRFPIMNTRKPADVLDSVDFGCEEGCFCRCCAEGERTLEIVFGGEY